MLHFFWLFTLLFFWISYAIFTKGRLTRHLGFFHFLLYFFAIYLSSFSIYEMGGSVNHDYITSVMLYPILSLLGMIFASLFGSKVYFLRLPIAANRKEVRLVSIIVAGFLIVYIFYLYGLWPNVPLLITLSGEDPMKGHMGRYFATKGYDNSILGLKFLYWLPRILIDYFSIFVAVFAYHNLQKKIADCAKLILIVSGLILLGMLSNEKYPAVKLFMLLALCHFNAKYETFGLRTIGASSRIVVAGLAVGSGVYALVSGAFAELAGLSLSAIPGFIIKVLLLPLLTMRGMVGQSYPLYRIYEIIPAQYDHFWGRTFSNPHGILPYVPVALPYLIYDSYNLPAAGDLKGADPTVFFGEIYANFALPISLISMFLFGFLIQIINSKLCDNIGKYRKPFDIAFFCLLMAYIGDFAIGFSVPYFDERLYFFAGIYLLRNILSARADEQISTRRWVQI